MKDFMIDHEEISFVDQDWSTGANELVSRIGNKYSIIKPKSSHRIPPSAVIGWRPLTDRVVERYNWETQLRNPIFSVRTSGNSTNSILWDRFCCFPTLIP
jgi:hypothetical protein